MSRARAAWLILSLLWLPFLYSLLFWSAPSGQSEDVMARFPAPTGPVTAGAVVDDTFYYAVNDKGLDLHGLAKEGSTKLLDLAGPAPEQHGPSHQINHLRVFGSALWVGADDGLYRIVLEGSDLEGPWLPVLTGRNIVTVTNSEDHLCVGFTLHKPVKAEDKKMITGGFSCFDRKAESTDLRGDVAAKVVRMIRGNLWVGGPGFLQIFTEGEPFAPFELIESCVVSGIEPIGESVWVWTQPKPSSEKDRNPCPSRPAYELPQVPKSGQQLAGFEALTELRDRGDAILSVSGFDDDVWIGSKKGEIHRIKAGKTEQIRSSLGGSVTAQKHGVTQIRRLGKDRAWASIQDRPFLIRRKAQEPFGVWGRLVRHVGQFVDADKTPPDWEVVPLLGARLKNDQLSLSGSHETSKHIFLWGRSGLHAIVKSLQLDFRTTSVSLFGSRSHIVWGSVLKIKEAGYYKEGREQALPDWFQSQIEDSQIIVSTPQLFKDPQQLKGKEKDENDRLGPVPFRRFNHHLGVVLFPRELTLQLSDSIGNTSDTRTHTYWPALPAFILGLIYLLGNIVTSVFLFLPFAYCLFFRKIWFRDYGSLFVFSRVLLTCSAVRRWLIGFYRCQLRKALEPKDPEKKVRLPGFNPKQPFTPIALRCLDPQDSHSGFQASTLPKLRQMVGSWREKWAFVWSPRTPVSVDLVTVVKNESSFREAALKQVEILGGVDHEGIQEQLLGDSRIVLCVTGLEERHLTPPKPEPVVEGQTEAGTKSADDDATVYWAAKELVDTYGPSHQILFFCPEKFSLSHEALKKNLGRTIRVMTFENFMEPYTVTATTCRPNLPGHHTGTPSPSSGATEETKSE